MTRVHDALTQAQVAIKGDTAGTERAGEPSHLRSTLDQYASEIPRRGEPDADEGLSVRGVIAPRTGGRHQLGPFSRAVAGKLAVGDGASPICVEQYRRLAGALHELQVERGLKSLLVTSALPNDGKSLTVSNLALTLSESYERRVLLIDADLRRPSIHEILSLPNASGLSDVLRSERGDIPILQVSRFLSVLTAGRPDANPMARLTSERMRTLLDQAAADFDWVLLDAVPVGLMPDARLLAGLTRAVLFVIGAGSTPYQFVTRAIAEIGPECVVGTVLNRVHPDNIPATSYYRHYYANPATSR
ncbi:MAG TPA: CpsD/CapB family tyrosine-protein kinase [Rhodothermales bacterium]